jgi:putative colanic acid biosynthesis acetyltransferase WcaF
VTKILRDHDRWPYSRGTYARRVLWRVAWLTLWKLGWHRVWPLRPLLLRLFGGRSGLRVGISGSVWIEMPWRLEIGDYCSIGPRVRLYNPGRIKIGDGVVISHDAQLCSATHDYTDPAYPLRCRPIDIGGKAWIAAGAFVGPGVTVGEGAVVGARAVAMKDVPPWTVVTGNPAEPLKRRELRESV